MKAQTLYRLGALAMIASAIGLAAGNLSYFLGGDAAVWTAPRAWLQLVTWALLVFSSFALYAALGERSGVLGFAGFVLLVLAMVVEAAQTGQAIAVASGTLAQGQTEQGLSYIAFHVFARYASIVGLILLGYTTARSGFFPGWTGALLLLVGVTNLFTGLGPLVQYLFAAVSSLAWISLGWALWKLWNRSRVAGAVNPREGVSAPAH
jgi:hypothetical protein